MTDNAHLELPSGLSGLEGRREGPSPDRIFLRDHVRELEIGAFQEERGIRQKVRFSVFVEITPGQSSAQDDVDKIMSYDSIVDAIEAESSAERANLLETLAEKIAARLLKDRRAHGVTVRIEKLDRVPGALGVEITRRKTDGGWQGKAEGQLEGDAESPGVQAKPTVVFLPNEIIYSSALRDWIDRLSDSGRKFIICVDLPPGDQSAISVDEANFRVGLLGVEQSAWILADLDSRCKVVDSKAELLRPPKEGQAVVWAPLKIAMKFPEGPDSACGKHLAIWLAGHLDAVECVYAGFSHSAKSMRLAPEPESL